MMLVDQLGSQSSSTIIGGVIALWEYGDYPVAMIILIASVFVPIIKFLMMIYLLVSVKYPIGHDKKINKHNSSSQKRIT